MWFDLNALEMTTVENCMYLKFCELLACQCMCYSSGQLKFMLGTNTFVFKDVRGWQFLTMKAAETLCIVCLPIEEHIS